jgi:hypothetical protein
MEFSRVRSRLLGQSIMQSVAFLRLTPRRDLVVLLTAGALAVALLLCPAGSAAVPSTQPAGLPEVSKRGLKVVVARNAPEAIRRAAQDIFKAVPRHPLLVVMAGTRPVGEPADSQALADSKPDQRAYDHLVIVGLPDDPLVRAAWQYEAKFDAESVYVFGFGYLSGDIGYIESDRNPFLHGAAIAKAPYETEVVTLTGTTPRGVALAVEAFLERGLVNGVIAAPGWKRSEPTILDQEPLAPNFAVPDWLPEQVGGFKRIGLTQGGKDEYRGVLADAGAEPQQIWRAKYFAPGNWDGVGAAGSMDNYSNGLHRRAYGSTLWCARFKNAAEAQAAAPKIAGAAKLKKQDNVWVGAQPHYADKSYGGKPSSGPLTLWQRGEWVLMSTLPPAVGTEKGRTERVREQRMELVTDSDRK